MSFPQKENPDPIITFVRPDICKDGKPHPGVSNVLWSDGRVLCYACGRDYVAPYHYYSLQSKNIVFN